MENSRENSDACAADKNDNACKLGEQSLEFDENSKSFFDPECPKHMGFSAGALFDEPLRMEVCGSLKDEFAVLEKPAGVLFDAYLGSPKSKSIIQAMRGTPEKPEFLRFGMVSPYGVNQLDFEMSGAALVAMNKESSTKLRNAIWSGFFTFEYFILTERAPDKIREDFTVNLPIFMHDERPVWIVSHRFGKKAQTRFQLIKTCGQYQIWRAVANVLRPNQIRLHAAEAGLKIVGEDLYSRTPLVYMSNLKRDYNLPKNVEEKPLYGALAVHLERLCFDGCALGMDRVGKFQARAKLPKAFAVMLKKIGFEEF